ncbi:MAG: aspartyl protease family protein [Marinifilaceae bacterium]
MRRLNHFLKVLGIICFLFLANAPILRGQVLDDFFQFRRPGQKSQRIQFKYANKALIIPLKINNSNTLHFIMDSGLGTTLITELTARDSFTINYAHEVYLQGLGTGPSLKAIKSYGNQISIASIRNNSEEINVLLEDIFSLSQKTGTQIHGIIGYSLFSRFIIEIDYINHMVTFHQPTTYKYKKSRRAVTFPLEITSKKPFIHTFITLHTGERIPVKLLIDTGSSLSLWLAESSHQSITIPDQSISTFIGQGLNGNIYGEIGRIQSLEIGPYHLQDVITAYPDTIAISETLKRDNRNGSIGGEVLRRFRVILDYYNKKVTFIRNRNLKEPFTYNMSGIELEMPFPGLPVFNIYYVNENSPAAKAGILKGDQLIAIGGVSVTEMDLDQILQIFQNENRNKVFLTIMRNGEILQKKIILEKEI